MLKLLKMNKFMILCCTGACVALPCATQAAEPSYVGAELTYLNRSAEGQTLSLDNSTGATMGGNDAKLGFEPGLRVVFGTPAYGYMLDGHLSYFGRWTGKDSLTSPGENIDPVRELASDDDDWTDAYRHSIDYESRMWGAGLMLSKGQAERVKYGLGLDYLDLREDFKWNTLDEASDLPGTNGNSNFKINTKNRLFGVTGAVSSGGWKLGQSVTAGAGLKAGIFANWAKQSASFENDLPSTADLGEGSSSKTRPAFLLEAQAKLDFAVAKTMTLSLGYRVAYLNGVALASEQVTFGNQAGGAAFNDRLGKLDFGSLFMHGAFVTLKGTF